MTTTSYTPDPARYWADEDTDKIASAVRYQWDRYQQRIKTEGRVAIWRIADLCYHGRSPDGGYSNAHAITFGGQDGEHAMLHIGQFRRHIQGQIGLATGQRPAIDVSAATNDAEAVASTQVARQVLEHDLDASGVERALVEAHTRAVLYSEGYLVQTWDPYAGALVGVDEVPMASMETDEGGIAPPDAEGTPGVLRIPVHEGGIRCEVRSPLDVARDLDADAMDGAPWYIVRTRRHRWELAARYPESDEIRRAILEAPGAPEDADRLHQGSRRASSGGDASDYVHVLTLYHMRTPALPSGRIVEIVEEAALPGDGPYVYEHCVVHADVPSGEIDRATGYADAWDMLAPQQALDAQVSAILTTADAGSVLTWVAPRGQAVDSRQLTTQLAVVEYDDNGTGQPPPRPAERFEVRQSDINVAEYWDTWLAKLSGQNKVVQGDPDANIKSGNFAALVASMAVRAIDGAASAYADLMRSVLTARVSLYRAFMEGERLVEIAGRDKSGHVRSFKASDLEGVRTVRVEIGSALMRTLHGKVELAQQMLAAYGPQVIGPARFFGLLETGRLDDLDATAIDKHKVIARRENDLFREGQGGRVMALVSDHHACHIAEHLEQLNDAGVRLDGDPQTITALAQHITQHAQLWPQTPPEILAATGQDPAPSTLMGPGPGGPPMGASGPGAPPDEPMMPEPDGPALTPTGGPLAPAEPAENPMTGAPALPGGM